MAEWFEKRTLGGLLDLSVTLFGNKEALSFEGQRWSFIELLDSVDIVARRIIKKKVKPRDKV